MRYPPALTFTPSASWAYRAFALLITLILIASCAVFIPANGHFSLKIMAYLALAAGASGWLLHDAWKKPRGSLHYAQGQWHHLQDQREIPGTLGLHIDLQAYMLVSFRAHSANNRLFHTTTQWFHLEARHLDHAAQAPAHAGAWSKLRRAVHSPMGSADEAVVA
ncbi:hypothetical protein [Variovorax sp. PCZ-1]|uniref:hypothetical protein n=1 Tax=Variovorax sp. PCZ-1 TaxID=2835533 RepID=UPI001BD126AC|nr:hypothetical protein [Variovorax sp. PCZ-1]MBS7808946.1 hypothetical protein [Variovorax sp. PCZ-1]